MLQGLYALSNVAAGNDTHKEAVMNILFSPTPSTSLGKSPCSSLTNGRTSSSLLMKYLQDMSNPQLRVVAVWCVINLTYPNSPGACDRVLRLRENGVEAHLMKMADDPCVDVKVGGNSSLLFLSPFCPNIYDMKGMSSIWIFEGLFHFRLSEHGYILQSQKNLDSIFFRLNYGFFPCDLRSSCYQYGARFYFFPLHIRRQNISDGRSVNDIWHANDIVWCYFLAGSCENSFRAVFRCWRWPCKLVDSLRRVLPLHLVGHLVMIESRPLCFWHPTIYQQDYHGLFERIGNSREFIWFSTTDSTLSCQYIV